MKLFLCLSFISQGQYYPKKCQSEGLKKVKKRDLPQKGAFLKKDGENMHAMHLQENYETEELYFSLSHYSIHHFSISFKRQLALCLNVVSFEIFFNDRLCIACSKFHFRKDLSYIETSQLNHLTQPGPYFQPSRTSVMEFFFRKQYFRRKKLPRRCSTGF